jgi:hypothetical protein
MTNCSCLVALTAIKFHKQVLAKAVGERLEFNVDFTIFIVVYRSLTPQICKYTNNAALVNISAELNGSWSNMKNAHEETGPDFRDLGLSTQWKCPAADALRDTRWQKSHWSA